MEISITVPDELAERLNRHWADIPRHSLEALVGDACREGLLSPVEAQQVLGLSSRYELDGFLKRCGVFLDYTAADLQQDLETYRGLSGQ